MSSLDSGLPVIQPIRRRRTKDDLLLDLDRGVKEVKRAFPSPVKRLSNKCEEINKLTLHDDIRPLHCMSIVKLYTP